MKTLVKARYNKPYCHEIADWLNSLGEDEEQYECFETITNGTVRRNWLRNDNYVEVVHEDHQS